jgi:hypothetical protein
MQNDTFKRLSRDLQDALGAPVSYLDKKTKKPIGTLGERKHRSPSLLAITKTSYLDIHEEGALATEAGNELEGELGQRLAGRSHGVYTPRSDSTSDCVSLHNFSTAVSLGTSLQQLQQQ